MSADDGAAAAIADWAVGVELDEIPDAVVDHATMLILDALGIALGASTFEFAHRAAGAARSLEPVAGEASVIGRPDRFPVRDAALLNGSLIHGLDYDDTYMPGTLHPTSSVLPACIAVGEQIGASGREVLTAYIVGVEVACALAEAVPPGGLVHRGFHPTGVIGAFAAAVAVGRLRRLPMRVLERAQGLVGSQAAGLMEFIETGAWVKRLHPGWAAASAITSVAFAASGITAPQRVYEGRFGLFATHLEAPATKVDDMVASLGEHWRLPSVAIKPYPVCHYIHALADAALELVAMPQFDRDAVVEVVCSLHPSQFSMVVDPLDRKRRPGSDYEAQFSAPYVVAATLLRGRFTLDELAPDALFDEDIRRLAGTIRFEAAPRSRFPQYFSGGVRVELRDGTTLDDFQELNRGSDARPLSSGDVRDKYLANASAAVTPERADAIAEQVAEFAAAGDLSRLLSWLRNG